MITDSIIKNINRLSLADKAFIITHPADFEESIRLRLVFYNNTDWTNELKSAGKYDIIKAKEKNELDDLQKIVTDIDDPDMINLYNYLKELYYHFPISQPDERQLEPFMRRVTSLFTHMEFPSVEIENKMIDIIYNNIFFNKLNALDILFKLEYELHFTPITIFHFISQSRDESYIGILLFAFFNMLYQHEKAQGTTNEAFYSMNVISTWVAIIAKVYSLDPNKILDTLKSFINNANNDVRVFDQIKDETKFDTSSIEKNMQIGKIKSDLFAYTPDIREQLFKKSDEPLTSDLPDQSTEFKDRYNLRTKKFSAILDNFADDTDIQFEVMRLLNGRLKDYLDSATDIPIFSSFSETELAYLKKAGYTIGKSYAYVNNNHWITVVLISKDDETFLIYKLNYDKETINGISLKENELQERRRITIEIPDEPLYQLSSENLVNVVK